MKILIDYLIIIIKSILILSSVNWNEKQVNLYPYYLRSEGRGEGVVVQKAWLFDYRKELKQMETF